MSDMMQGLDPQGGVDDHVADAADQTLRTTLSVAAGGRMRPNLRYLKARGASSIVLRNVTTAADCSPVFYPAGGEICISGFGPTSTGATGWPGRGQTLGYSVVVSGNTTVEYGTDLIR